MPIYVEQLIADDFEEHQARAGRSIVTASEAEQVWNGGFVSRRNVRGAAGTRFLIGRTAGGRRITLVSRHLGDGL